MIFVTSDLCQFFVDCYLSGNRDISLPVPVSCSRSSTHGTDSQSIIHILVKQLWFSKGTLDIKPGGGGGLLVETGGDARRIFSK